MKNRKFQLAMALTILLLTSLACQALSSALGDGTESTPAASPTNETLSSPTAIVESTESSPSPTEQQVATQPVSTSPQELPPLPPAQPGPETLDLSSLPEVHPLTDFSERIRSVMQFTDPDGAQQEMVSLYDFRQTSVPGQAWYRLFDDNNPFVSQKYESALISGSGYNISSDSSTCQYVIVEVFDNSGQRQPFVDLIAALTGQVSLSEPAVSLGDQVVDGYPVENSNLAAGSEIKIEMTTSDDSGTSTSTTTIQLADDQSVLESGKLYLAQQGGYLAKLELVYTKVATEDDAFIAQPGSTMTRTLTYEAVPAASVEPIQPPQGCAESTGEGGEESGGEETGGTGSYTINDLPRLGDESNVVQAGDSLIFQTGQDMQSVLNFYRDSLQAAGWEVTDEINLGSLASMELVREAQTLSITLMPSGEAIMVTIVLQ